MRDSEFWQKFNNFASGAAALGGIAALVVSGYTSHQVSTLSRLHSTSQLIGDLTDNLTSKKMGRDVSLLALEHALNSENSGDIRDNSKLLLARIASLIIHQASVEDDMLAADNSDITESLISGSKREFGNSVDQATQVLQRLIRKSDNDCNALYDSKIQLQATPPDANAATPPSLSAKCKNEAASLAINTLEKAILGQSPTGRAIESPSQLALALQETKDPTVVSTVVAQARVNSLVSEKILEDSRRGNHKTEDSLAVVTIHIDSESNMEFAREVQDRLSEKKWFVVAGVRSVSPTSPSCGDANSVRHFHARDSALADGLIRDLEAISKDSKIDQALSRLVKGEGNAESGIKKFDLSDWKFASAVPPQNVELWLVSNGMECKQSKDQKNLKT